MIVKKALETENFFLKSRGLFSSWCLYKPHSILFDCGDGCAQDLGYRIFKPNVICISHAHVDHISGLLSFIGLRNKTKGDNYKTLTILYPKGDVWCEKHFKYIFDIIPKKHLSFKVNLIPISDQETYDINSKIFIRAFSTKHTKASLGYVVCEKSTRLKEEYKKIPDIGKKLASREILKEDALESGEVKKFAYTLDNCGFDIENVKGVKEIILDSTFLDIKDRNENTHCTKQECEEMVEKIKPKAYYLAHISPRY